MSAPAYTPKIYWVYVTSKSRDEALSIARSLVSEDLVACVNVLSHTISVYRWQGKIHEDDEVAWVAKTTTLQLDKVISRIKQLHSYDCPCIIALPVENGHADFLEWVRTSCEPKSL